VLSESAWLYGNSINLMFAITIKKCNFALHVSEDHY